MKSKKSHRLPGRRSSLVWAAISGTVQLTPSTTLCKKKKNCLKEDLSQVIFVQHFQMSGKAAGESQRGAGKLFT